MQHKRLHAKKPTMGPLMVELQFNYRLDLCSGIRDSCNSTMTMEN